MSKRKGSNVSVPASDQGDKRQKSTSKNVAPSRTAVVSTADVVESTVQSAMNLAIKDAKDNKVTIKGWTVGWVNTLDKEGAKHWLVVCGKWQPDWAKDGVTKRRVHLISSI